MPETQLGSMRLGSVDMPDEEEREGKTGVAQLIHIADGQSDEILGDIAPEYIIDDTHRQSLEDMLETFEFYTFGDKPFTQHLKDRNRIIIPDEDGTLREFIIYESEKYRDTEGYKMYVIGTASYLDLKKANVIRPGSFTGTASQHLGMALNGTEFRPGIVEVSGSKTLHRENFTNPFDYLKKLRSEFEGELRFRIEHNGNRITGRFVDLLERIGEWRGREVTFGKDLDGIRRIENTERIVTALVGLGPEREDGTRLEVLVEDDEALQRWGRPDPVTGELRHLIEVYEPESEREDMTEAELRQYTQTELNKRINAVVTYECSVVDLENVPGMENKQIRFGDIIKIKDTKFNPPLYIEARVFEQERSIKSKAKKTIKLGDFVEYTEEDVRAIWRQLQEQIRKKISIADLRAYAEPKKIESDTPPPIREGENPIWVDTSKTPHVPHVVIANEWVKMSPTEAQEIGAETPQGAQEKADTAEQNAKSYTDIIKSDLEDGIQQAQTTADGKNSVFTQSTAPPTTGRKIGDVWFDTSRDNLMHRFDGTQWVEAKWGEQSIVANSITANHIKSLAGLNVNDQFIVDSNGNVKLANDTVTIDRLGIKVKEADFLTEDAQSGMVSKIVPMTNLIRDHSFELIKAGSLLSDGYYRIAESPVWYLQGSPRCTNPYPDGTDVAPIAPFGDQSILVNSSNYVIDRESSWYMAPGETYTLSAYFHRPIGYGVGTPQFRIQLFQHDEVNGQPVDRILYTSTSNFSPVPSDYSLVRYSHTFTLPSNFEWEFPTTWVDIEIKSTNSTWVVVDGVQLVRGTYPTAYDAEDSLWRVAKGYIDIDRTGLFWDTLWSGQVYLLDTHNITPSKPISECETGWVLQWQRYNPGVGVENSNYQFTHIPKTTIFNLGTGHRALLRSHNVNVTKYFYVYENHISGHADNGSGDNRYLVLTAVYEY